MYESWCPVSEFGIAVLIRCLHRNVSYSVPAACRISDDFWCHLITYFVFSLCCVLCLSPPPPRQILSSSSLFYLLIFKDCVFSLVYPHHVAHLDRFIGCFQFLFFLVCLHSVASWLSFLMENRPYLSHALPCVWLTSHLIDFYETLCQPEWLYFVCEGSSRSRFDLSRNIYEVSHYAFLCGS
jgi:hypothetical protein